MKKLFFVLIDNFALRIFRVSLRRGNGQESRQGFRGGNRPHFAQSGGRLRDCAFVLLPDCPFSLTSNFFLLYLF